LERDTTWPALADIGAQWSSFASRRDEVEMEAEYRRLEEKIHADEQAMLHRLTATACV
jgi:hypothetical protein